MRLDGSRGGTWEEVLLGCLFNSDINMSIYILTKETVKIRELVTIIGEKTIKSHLTRTLKDGVIYEKAAEGLSLRGFCRDKKVS